MGAECCIFLLILATSLRRPNRKDKLYWTALKDFTRFTVITNVLSWPICQAFICSSQYVNESKSDLSKLKQFDRLILHPLQLTSERERLFLSYGFGSIPLVSGMFDLVTWPQDEANKVELTMK